MNKWTDRPILWSDLLKLLALKEVSDVVGVISEIACTVMLARIAWGHRK